MPDKNDLHESPGLRQRRKLEKDVIEVHKVGWKSTYAAGPLASSSIGWWYLGGKGGDGAMSRASARGAQSAKSTSIRV